MKYKKKLLTTLVVSICVLGTLNIVYQNKVKASPPNDEIPIDYEFIQDVSDALTQMVFENTSKYWMGREFGSEGERDAAEILKTKWIQNIGNNQNYYVKHEDIDAEINRDAFDNKFGIVSQDDYCLKIGNDTLDQDEYFAIPCYKVGYKNLPNTVYEVKIAPDSWYQDYCGVPTGGDQEVGESTDLTHFEIDYASLNGENGVEGDLCYNKMSYCP